LGVDVKLVTNPIFLRMAMVFFAGAFAFILGTLLMKKIKRGILQESVLGEGTSSENLPLHTYHAVIQQLKQQKHELQALQQQERRRSKTTENLSTAVLSNLSSGVLFFNTAGLVRQANAAAKLILGFASLTGMNAEDLFRDAQAQSKGSTAVSTPAGAVRHTLEHATLVRRLEVDYVKPGGEQRVLELTVSPVYGSEAQMIGASCVIDDQTEIVAMRRRQELRGDMSAEMALELKNSLASIADYAQSLASHRDQQKAQQLANDIAAEAQLLERRIGGFLAAAKTAGSESRFR
jgi:nitrogen fixation/metabolism regulation signal transduction histidine kinase